MINKIKDLQISEKCVLELIKYRVDKSRLTV